MKEAEIQVLKAIELEKKNKGEDENLTLAKFFINLGKIYMD